MLTNTSPVDRPKLLCVIFCNNVYVPLYEEKERKKNTSLDLLYLDGSLEKTLFFWVKQRFLERNKPDYGKKNNGAMYFFMNTHIHIKMFNKCSFNNDNNNDIYNDDDLL